MIGYWTTNRVNQLQDLWLRNSASEIAVVMGITRNSVLGKAHRLGLDSKQLLNAVNKPRTQLSQPRIVTSVSRITNTPIATLRLSLRRKPEPTKNELRAMLADAVRNTAGMQA